MTLCFLDTETRSLSDVTQCGAFSYACDPSTEVIVISYAFDNEMPRLWSPHWAWGNMPKTHYDPERPEDLLDHIVSSGYVIAWNAFFDRVNWNEVLVKKYGWPKLVISQVLCAQAQAEANNLPGGLEKAAIAVGAPFRKDPKGKALIKKLSTGTREDWDSARYENSEYMGHFRAYCASDVNTMRAVWQRTRPLTEVEWHEYHASERINERGVMVDVEFAKAAQHYARAEFADINAELRFLTEDPRLTVTAHLRKAQWLHDQLWCDPELQEIVRRPVKGGEDKSRYSCDRPTRDAVLETITQPEHAARFEPEHADTIVRFLELIEAGNSAAVRKFTTICEQAYKERVHGSYSFNGAGQTGRFSARGLQVHNIIRAPVDKNDRNRAIDAIEMIMDGADTDTLRNEFGYPISRLLARLIRPTIIAPPNKTLIWADWDQIEARVLPWLADSKLSKKKLKLYRDGVDVYVHTAAAIDECEPEDVTDDQRQSLGKVPELALGFGGGPGALSAMARNYGVHFTEDEKKDIVQKWRKENVWARHFWSELWQAAMDAYNNFGETYSAGRVSYIFSPQLMNGSLVCILPDERLLVYPQFRHERVTYIDDQERERQRWRTSFMKGFGSGSGRVECWYGTLAENVTQAVAASMLRLALLRLDPYAIVVLHTHDEIVCEVLNDYVSQMEDALRDAMTELPDWADGLPLTVSVESGPFYTK